MNNKLFFFIIAASISAAMMPIATVAATDASLTDSPMISGKRSYTFSGTTKNPGEKHPFVFTKAEVNKITCDKTRGYYWCQAQARCLKVALEKCKLTSIGTWYDGTTSEKNTKTAKTRKAMTQAPPKHGQGRADAGTIITTGRRQWGGLSAAAISREKAMGRY